MGQGYNTQFLLYAQPMNDVVKLIFAVFICVTQWWALHVVIKTALFYILY